MRHVDVAGIGRREFLKGSGAAILGLGAFGASGLAASELAAPGPRAARGHGPEDDGPGTHNMLVVGERTVFLSHLPMFDGATRDQAARPLATPHHYQVLLEATFVRDGRPVQDVYARDRRAHPQVRMYTLMPEPDFVLRRLFAPDPGGAPLRAFTAGVHRGHLERGGVPVPGLERVTVEVTRVVHAHRFAPGDLRPATLEYLLFGRGDERFLAHALVRPPDFDQVLAVRVGGPALTDADLARGLRVRMPGRGHGVSQRLRPGVRVAGELVPQGASGPAVPVELDVGTEFYFEEGELRAPATFAQTGAERAAGF